MAKCINPDCNNESIKGYNCCSEKCAIVFIDKALIGLHQAEKDAGISTTLDLHALSVLDKYEKIED